MRDPLGQTVVESVLQDKSLIKCSSVGLSLGNKLLVGTVRDRMLSCDLHYITGRAPTVSE